MIFDVSYTEIACNFLWCSENNCCEYCVYISSTCIHVCNSKCINFKHDGNNTSVRVCEKIFYRVVSIFEKVCNNESTFCMYFSVYIYNASLKDSFEKKIITFIFHFFFKHPTFLIFIKLLYLNFSSCFSAFFNVQTIYTITDHKQSLIRSN